MLDSKTSLIYVEGFGGIFFIEIGSVLIAYEQHEVIEGQQPRDREARE